jgi:hypothetical protein
VHSHRRHPANCIGFTWDDTTHFGQRISISHHSTVVIDSIQSGIAEGQYIRRCDTVAACMAALTESAAPNSGSSLPFLAVGRIYSKTSLGEIIR